MILPNAKKQIPFLLHLLLLGEKCVLSPYSPNMLSLEKNKLINNDSPL